MALQFPVRRRKAPAKTYERWVPAGSVPRHFILLRVWACLAAPFFLMTTFPPFTTCAQGGAQGGTFNVADVDSGKIQPLNLKPGCWQIRTHTSTDVNLANLPAPAEPGPAKLPTVDEAMKQWLASLTPDQRAHLTQAQMDQTREILTATLSHPVKAPSAAELQKQQAEFLTKTLAQGGGGTAAVCTATPFLPQGKELYGTSPKECTRSIQASGAELLGHITCPGRVADYKRIDAEHVSGTIVSNGVSHPDAKTGAVHHNDNDGGEVGWRSHSAPALQPAHD